MKQQFSQWKWFSFQCQTEHLRSGETCVLLVFLDINVVVFHELIPHGTTVNTECDCNTLRCPGINCPNCGTFGCTTGLWTVCWFWPQQHNHFSSAVMFTIFGSMWLLPLPQGEIKTKVLPFWHSLDDLVFIPDGAWTCLSNETCRNFTNCCRSTWSRASLHRETTSTGMWSNLHLAQFWFSSVKCLNLLITPNI